MLFLFGTHRFRERKTAVRKDFCNACERECVAEHWCSSDWGHLFFVPILPLGTRKRWRCTLCGKAPRARYKTAMPFRILGLIVLPCLFLPALLMPNEHPLKRPEDAYAPYVGAAMFGLPWLYLVYSTFFKRAPAVTEDQRRRAVTPLSTESCFYCRGPLKRDPDYHCDACGIRVEVDRPTGPPPLPPI